MLQFKTDFLAGTVAYELTEGIWNVGHGAECRELPGGIWACTIFTLFEGDWCAVSVECLPVAMGCELRVCAEDEKLGVEIGHALWSCIDPPKVFMDRRSVLTPKQIELLDLLAKGKALQQAAVDLGKSEQAMRHRLQGAYDRTGIHSMVELVSWYKLSG